MWEKNANVAHIKKDANCISKLAHSVDKVRKKAAAAIAETEVPAVMGRPPLKNAHHYPQKVLEEQKYIHRK